MWQGSTARKPYNPIIGECFHCSWALDDADISSAKCASSTLTTNSLSSFSAHQLSTAAGQQTRLYYCAEQVSHHPPGLCIVCCLQFFCRHDYHCLTENTAKTWHCSVSVITCISLHQVPKNIACSYLVFMWEVLLLLWHCKSSIICSTVVQCYRQQAIPMERGKIRPSVIVYSFNWSYCWMVMISVVCLTMWSLMWAAERTEYQYVTFIIEIEIWLCCSAVSAFYFESPEKQMYMNASIWTRSKFMGMSIGVALIGKGVLYLISIYVC